MIDFQSEIGRLYSFDFVRAPRDETDFLRSAICSWTCYFHELRYEELFFGGSRPGLLGRLLSVGSMKPCRFGVTPESRAAESSIIRSNKHSLSITYGIMMCKFIGMLTLFSPSLRRMTRTHSHNMTTSKWLARPVGSIPCN